MNNGWRQQCGTEVSEYHRLYECVAHERTRPELPRDISSCQQNKLSQVKNEWFERETMLRYEWEETEHRKEEWTSQNTLAAGGRFTKYRIGTEATDDFLKRSSMKVLGHWLSESRNYASIMKENQGMKTMTQYQ